MGFGDKFKKMVAIAAPIVGSVFGPVGTMAGAAIGGAITGSLEKDEAKKLNASGQGARDAQGRLLEQSADETRKFMEGQRAQSKLNIDRINKDIEANAASLAEAKRVGDTEREALFNSQIAALNKNLEDESSIATENEAAIRTQIETGQTTARGLVQGDLSAEEAIRQESLGSFDDALQTQVERDQFASDTIGDAIPRSLDDIEQGLTGARTAQDEQFKTAIAEAERGAAKRGEDPRRATLNLKIAQAKARGKLTFDTIRSRALDRVNIAAQANQMPGGQAQASIAAERLGFKPTSGSRLAEMELNFLGQNVSRQDVANQRAEILRNQTLEGKLAAEGDVRAGRGASAGAFAGAQIQQRDLGTKSILDQQSLLSKDELAATNANRSDLGGRADQFGADADASFAAAAEAKKRGSDAITGAVTSGIGAFTGSAGGSNFIKGIGAKFGKPAATTTPAPSLRIGGTPTKSVPAKPRGKLSNKYF